VHESNANRGDEYWLRKLFADCLVGGECRFGEFKHMRVRMGFLSVRDKHLALETIPSDASSPRRQIRRPFVRRSRQRASDGVPATWRLVTDVAESIGSNTREWERVLSTAALVAPTTACVAAVEVSKKWVAALFAKSSESAAVAFDPPEPSAEDPFQPVVNTALAVASLRTRNEPDCGELVRQHVHTLLSTNRREHINDTNVRPIEDVTCPENLYGVGAAYGRYASRWLRVETVDITPTLIRQLRESPQELRNLTPEMFERFVAERLDRMGFDVAITGGAFHPDGGIDLLAVPKRRTVGTCLLAVQVKHHKSSRAVTRADVDRILAWQNSEFRLGLIVTNTRFTDSARWLAEHVRNRPFLRLRDFSALQRWLRDDFSNDVEWAELPSSVQLAPGIRVEIPPPFAGVMLSKRR